MDFLLLIISIALLYAYGARLLWWSTKKDWARYEMHSCGQMSWTSSRPCPKCGEADHKWQVVYARAKFFGGWEWKVPPQ